MTSKLGPSELMFRNSTKKLSRRREASNAEVFGVHSITDAETNHYIPQNGDIMNDRYVTETPCVVLGRGTFGVVIKAYDTATESEVAIKVIRAQENYTYAANNEIRILTNLLKNDGTDTHIVPIVDHFVYAYHTCIVTPLLGISLYDLNRNLSYRGFPFPFFKSCMVDILTGTWHIHQNKLVHTDLKPENVLFENNRQFDLQGGRYNTSKPVSCMVIDLGSSQPDRGENAALICTRQYRPPEVVCGLSWDRSADIWSIGCIAFELFTGNVLFNTHDSYEHLALIQQTIGPPPFSFSRKASNKKPDYFTAHSEPRIQWPPINGIPANSKMDQNNAVDRTQPLRERLETAGKIKNVPVADLYNFIMCCLKWNPYERLSALDLLNHDLFSGMLRSNNVPSLIPLKSMATKKLRETDYYHATICMLRYIVAVHNAVRDTTLFNMGKQSMQLLNQIDSNEGEFDYSIYGSACMLFGQTKEILNRERTISARVLGATHVTDETLLY